ncbi:hypothetical protein KYG_09195 [Acidovorax sp. NO-1]|uniref:hypothetical protein n=1 Tax=Acidovorax sp. NO-1 TaxID=512030 RepID=UPI00023FC93C|nr:hypothetical protein [Acidovorax sp. NO-1]EHL23000.1 hypothetical protein KYG_09195 [Acidovorax sp. NO-1]
MAIPIDLSRSALPPVAQFLAEAALQRQSALLGPDKPGPVAAPAPLSGADPSAPPPSVASPSPPAGPLPTPADKASISPQAREQLAAGFDPRGGGAANSGLQGARGDGALRAAPPALPSGAQAASQPSGSATTSGASALRGAAWPTSGLGAPLLRLVSALVAQVTAQAGVPQRVVAAQPWPIGMAQALESGALDADQPPLQTWLVRQGVVLTPEGPRGMALTLRAPVPWLAAQQAQTAGLGAGAQTSAAGALQVPFAGGGQALQSGVMALVLQGMEAAAPRTSALLVMDLQPQLAAAVYGREMLQQATTGRLDPWTQMAVLQASGQVPREDERARNGASGLCDTVGCPYAARAACVQPFCLAMRGVLPPEPVGPALPA